MHKKEKLLKIANDKFGKQQYESALMDYAMILQKYPGDKEAKTGAILTEMAMNHEDGAEALFDYYAVLKSSDLEIATEVMEEIINSMDGGLEKISEIVDEARKSEIMIEDGITYSDFKALIEERGDFKRTFEDIMFSTRVVITDRNDFIDFLELLVQNGFNEMAINYMESAMQAFPNDEKIREIYRLIDQKSLRES